ncbi:MAG: metal ABC transporter ATP-binding protein [Planctomycetes bacterium]|nr:metal ABC transporter ATP-binding protein [Planctomycetota bacterium]
MKSATRTTPLIRLRGAAFGYAGERIVSGVDLDVDAGRFFGIVGPNGAGKTTLFRGILGLLPVLAGSCARAPGLVCGYVPQRESLDAGYPLSALEVVEMGAYRRLNALRRLVRGEREAALGLLARMGLGAEQHTPFSALSGGQRQRVLLARALLTRPDVLLLDEPTSGVDRGAQEQILRLLRELHQEGLAILLVSHQLALVRESVGEVLVVTNGRVQCGDPRELLAPERLDALFGAGAESG